MAKRSVVWSACAVALLAGCGKHLDTQSVKDWLNVQMIQNFDEAPIVKTCPDRIPQKQDTTFECKVDFGFGVEGTVHFRETDDNGSAIITDVTGLVSGKLVQDSLVESVGKQLGTTVTARCFGGPRVAKIGDTFACTVTSKGVDQTVNVTLTDDHGGFSYAPVETAPAANTGSAAQ
ncbi:MAG TPA: DUF4333 domain-containing protein [Kofleriaceae bacterium]|jgi:hypothetical protein